MLATSADRYTLLAVGLGDAIAFPEVKRQALSISLLASQAHCSALELVPEFRGTLPRGQAPPLMALLLLGAIASSCTVIAACATPRSLEGVTLLSAKRLQAMISSQEVAAWLQAALS